MAASFVLSTAARSALAGSTAMIELLNAGHLHIYDGTAPGPNSAPDGTKLSDHTLPNPVGTVASGVLTFNTVTDVNASSSGTAQYFRLLESDNSTVVAEGNVGLAATTITVNTVNFTSGGPVTIVGFTITIPAGT